MSVEKSVIIRSARYHSVDFKLTTIDDILVPTGLPEAVDRQIISYNHLIFNIFVLKLYYANKVIKQVIYKSDTGD